MAKKTKKASETVTLTVKDKKTLGSIRDLADDVVQSVDRGRAPYVDIPSRSLSNVKFSQSKRIIEMGRGTNRRELFNLSQARSYMQTLLVGTGCKQLIDQGLIHMERSYASATDALTAKADKFESDMRDALTELEKKHAFERG